MNSVFIFDNNLLQPIALSSKKKVIFYHVFLVVHFHRGSKSNVDHNVTR